MNQVLQNHPADGNDPLSLAPLIDMVARLRSECPWFQGQDLQTWRGYVLEEACEVLVAITAASPEALCAELGDLLFQVLVLTQLAGEKGWFSSQAVLAGLSEKIRRRNPHVFPGAGSQGNGPAKSVAEVQALWAAAKAQESQPGNPQWVPGGEWSGAGGTCPVCGAQQEMGTHAVTCLLAAALHPGQAIAYQRTTGLEPPQLFEQKKAYA